MFWAAAARRLGGSLIIIWHSRTGASEALARAAAQGAGHFARLMPAADAQARDLLEAGGFLFVCPENLGTMTGQMKEMFDRCYYPLLGQIEGRPYASIIAAGSDGEGTQRQLDRIVTGWRLRRVAEPLIVGLAAQTPAAILSPKIVPAPQLVLASELGMALAQGLEQGIF